MTSPRPKTLNEAPSNPEPNQPRFARRASRADTTLSPKWTAGAAWTLGVAALVVPLAIGACITPKKSGPGSDSPTGGGDEPLTAKSEAATSGTPHPATPVGDRKNVSAIKVNTVGYPPEWQKIAIFNVQPASPVVADAESGEVVLEIDVSTAVNRGVDAASQDPTWQVDFTALKKPGRYVIRQGEEKSEPFTVSRDVYAEALVAGLKQFYFQRDRTALVEPYAVWKGKKFLRKGKAHDHEDVGWDFEHFPEKKKEDKWTPDAGWHDAGNYDLYVNSQAPTIQSLFMAYEAKQGVFPDSHFNIPESGNRVPDILDEARWGLRWVLSMQEKDGPNAGAFRVRETNLTPGEREAPDEDLTVRWIDFVGSAATAKACAVTAMASRLFEKWDPAFAKRNAASARAAWAWLKKNPKRVPVKELMGAAGKNSFLVWDDAPDDNPEGREVTDLPARFVCAVEYWRAFRDPAALEQVKSLLKAEETQPTKGNYLSGEWGNLSRLGVMVLAQDDGTPPAIREEAKKRVLAAADLMKAHVEEEDGYRNANWPEDYIWASNSKLLERAHVMLEAYRLDPEGHRWALEAAKDQWHWILGRNPNGYSMVTQVGKGPTALYHQEWQKYAPELPPGYLLGGPNGSEMKFLAPGAPAKAIIWDNPEPLSNGTPAHAMFHWNQESLWEGGFLEKGVWWPGWYACTEGDILYNGNLVLVGAYMQAQ